MSWYSDIKAFIANNITTNHARAITGAKMNTVLNDIVDEVDGKVDKVSGKGLSTNDYNNTEKAKVANAYSKPSGGIPKTDLASAVQTSLGKADTAVQTETDPTVPSWAKAQTKPAYTASEVGAIPATDKGANGGVATLDNAGKVPQSQLPSYVDDVLEYANLSSFPATGESGKIYVALDTNKTYRWSGSVYVEISESLALGETSSTAFAGDRGKAIEDKIPSNASSSNKLATKTESVPAGGTTGQVLAKKSNTDNDLEWVNQSGGGGGSSNYNDLSNKPSINNITLSGNKTAAQLGLQDTLTIDATPTEDSTNPVQSGGVFDVLSDLIAENALFGGIVGPESQPWQGADHRYFYLAIDAGTYVNFNNLEIYGPSLIRWNLDFWGIVTLWTSEEDLTASFELKADKVSGATEGNLAGLDYEGNLTDSGSKPSDFASASDVNDIKGKIPAQASSQNQLADKDFVNSSIATATATFKGTFNLVTDLSLSTSASQSDIATALAGAVSGEDNNDYAFVQIPTSDSTPTEISRVDRYKYNGTAWGYEFSLNNSSFTSSQWAAINSGITASLVNSFGNKYEKPSGGIPASDLASAVQTSLGKADTALQSYTESDPVFSTSPAAGITSGDIADWDGKADPIPVVDASTIPASMDADKVYQYGTLSGDTTFPALNAPTDLTVAHVYCWTFTTPATAPTITWPSAITSWAGGSAPTINASKSYEVSVMDGFATIIEN